MEKLLDDIAAALKARLYSVAIGMTLTLPDICAALESPDGLSSGARYMSWYDTNMANIRHVMTGADCYRLRCGVLHQGRYGHPKMQQFGRVIFMMPNVHRLEVHDCIVDDALILDPRSFFLEIRAAVETWLAAKQDDGTVQSNLANLVQYRHEGLRPYINLPLIA